MTITFTGAGTAVSATGASSQAVTTTTAFAVGDYIVAFMAYDNTGGGGADPVSGVTSMAVSAGSVVGGSAMTGLNDPGAASAGLAARADIRKVTGAIASGSTVTVSWSGTVTIRSVVLMKVSTDVSGATLNARINSGNGSTMTNTVGAATATLVTPSATAGEGVLGYAGHENGAAFTGDADTTNGTWSAVYGAFQGTGATGMAAYFQAKVVTATATQSWDITGTSSDWIQGATIFTETAPPPAVTQAAYRWYWDDGTESGATALTTQDTAPTVLVDSNIGYVLRVRLQLTTSAVSFPSDDWQLQVDKNASGSWVSITTGSANAFSYNSANLTDAAATTSRLTGGTGTFQAGKVSETGVVTDLGWSGSNYTELLFPVTLKASDVAHNDVLRFRVLRNGATTEMTYTVTPTVTVAKTPVKIELLTHDFSSNTGLTMSSVTTTVVGGQLRLDLSSTNTAGCTFNALRSNYTLEGSGIFTEVARPPASLSVANAEYLAFLARIQGVSGSNYFSFELRATAGLTVGFRAWRTINNGGFAVTTAIEYDPVAHRWLRIRESAGTIYWDTSPDAIIWTNFTTWAHTFTSAQLVHPNGGFSTYIGSSAATGDYALFDNFNLVAPLGGTIKVWSGSAWVDKPVKVWTGAAWVQKPVKVWSGSAWVLS
jgi:hypothetical protein